MKFIVIEGLDGAGKSTQIKLLSKEFAAHNLNFFYLHFPRTDSPVFGELVARFLRGEFGKNEDVNPYLVALIYAGDRNDAAALINKHLNSGDYVIVDRYVYSNIAYQCAKLSNYDSRKKLMEWILNLEYNYYNIPQPDISLFLDVPNKFTKENLTSSRKGDDRNYLNGNIDIHENDLDFQDRVRNIYLEQAQTDEKFEIINCNSDKNRIYPPEKIFEIILDRLKQKMIL